MTAYLLRRIGQSLLVIATALTVMFLVGHVLGDPVSAIVSEFASEESREAVRTELGFNDPLGTQFVRFMRRAITLDFGASHVSGRSAMGMVLGPSQPQSDSPWASFCLPCLLV